MTVYVLELFKNNNNLELIQPFSLQKILLLWKKKLEKTKKGIISLHV